MEIEIQTLGGWLAGVIGMILVYLGIKKVKKANAAAPATPPEQTREAAAIETGTRYTETGDLVVDGIYTHFAEGDTTATRPYDNTDPDEHPKVWVRVTGVKPGRVLVALRVDGRGPADESEIEAVDTGGFIGQHGLAILPYPKYASYRVAGVHEVAVLVGRVPDGETDGMQAEWLKVYPFDVTVKKKAATV